MPAYEPTDIDEIKKKPPSLITFHVVPIGIVQVATQTDLKIMHRIRLVSSHNKLLE